MKRRPRAARRPTIVVATEEAELAALAYLNARDAIAIAQAALDRAGAVLEGALGDADELRGTGWSARRCRRPGMAAAIVLEESKYLGP